MRPSAPGLGEDRGATGTSRSRSIRISRTSVRRPSSRRRSCTNGSTSRTCSSRSPAPSRVWARSRDSIAAGRSINITLLFSLPPQGSHRGVPARIERPIEGGGDPSRVTGRELLRVPRIPKRTNGWRPSGPKRRLLCVGSSRSRTRSSPTRTTWRRFRERWKALEEKGRDPATLSGRPPRRKSRVP